jgi:colanic acid biosynthesis glycosyl transferase WcaI
VKILVSSINFYPDHSGIALYSTDLPVYCAEHGHEVTVVTGFPYYPVWRKRPQDRRRLLGTDEYRSVKVLRGYLYVPEEVSTFKRILHELSFVLFAVLNFLRAGRHDCIVIFSPPLLLGLVGVVFKSLWKAQLVVDLQDLQPDAALSLGMVRHNFLVTALLKLEALVYRRASWIATISGAMRKNLVRKGVPEEKLGLYPNWIDVADASRVGRLATKGTFLSKHRVSKDKFTIAYAGNIGVKQGVDILVRLAEASQAYEDIHYFVIGEGSRRRQLEEFAAQKALTNITFLPFLPQGEYFEMLQDIDVSFVSQRSGTGDVFFPSKLLGIMAMRKPLLVSADPDSELSRVISGAGCGLVSSPNDMDSLLRDVLSLLHEPSLRERLGENGRRHVELYDRERVLSGFLARISGHGTRSAL